MSNLGRLGRGRLGTFLGLSTAVLTLLFVALLPGIMAAPALPGTAPKTCTVGKQPGFPGYDPVNHEMYIPNSLSSNITVFKGTCTKVGTIKLPSGSFPLQAAFDPQNNHMYVTDNLLNQV
jgi:hypothetical protein